MEISTFIVQVKMQFCVVFFLLQKISETKLRSLYTDLLAQDKEESTLKRLKSDGLDKDGLKEASVRKKFKGLCCHDD